MSVEIPRGKYIKVIAIQNAERNGIMYLYG